MTSEQFRLYNAALRIGRTFGTGGSAWTPITPSGNGITAARTLTVGALVTGYAIENNLIRQGQALAGALIYTAPWWFIGSLTPESIIVSASDGSAFLAQGPPDTSQGFSVTPLTKTQVPDMATVSTRAAGYQAGLRTGAW